MRNVTIRTLLSCAAVAFVVSGCSNATPAGPTASSFAVPGAVTSAGQQTANLAHFSDPGATGIAGSPDIACPTQAPRIANAGIFGLRIDLQWQPIQNITRYEVQLEH